VVISVAIALHALSLGANCEGRQRRNATGRNSG
jgi:hypothetical protein